MIATRPAVGAWPAAMIVWGQGFAATPHHHPCIQLIMTLRGSLRIRGRWSQPWRRCGAVVIGHDVVHEVDTRGAPVVLVFAHTESELGVALGELLTADITSLSAGVVARWRATIGSPRATRIDQWVRTDLLNGAPPARIDVRIQRVVAYIRQHIGTSRDFSLATLADFATLSRSRFMHLFTQAVGAALRPYVRWVRVQRAACELVDGARISTAAHRAGFADAAHLNRTFRRMLGMTPSHIANYGLQGHGLSLLR